MATGVVSLEDTTGPEVKLAGGQRLAFVAAFLAILDPVHGRDRGGVWSYWRAAFPSATNRCETMCFELARTRTYCSSTPSVSRTLAQSLQIPRASSRLSCGSHSRLLSCPFIRLSSIDVSAGLSAPLYSAAAETVGDRLISSPTCLGTLTDRVRSDGAFSWAPGSVWMGCRRDTCGQANHNSWMSTKT